MSDELVNNGRVTIVKGDPVTDFWLDGTVNRYPDYSFKAKVYDIGSIFGIGEGRISKLQVWRDGREVMSYDRDWDQVPKSRRDLKALKEILSEFPDRGKETSGIEVAQLEHQVGCYAAQIAPSTVDTAPTHPACGNGPLRVEMVARDQA